MPPPVGDDVGDCCGDKDAATLPTGELDGAGVGLSVVGRCDGDDVGPAVLGAGVGPLVLGAGVGPLVPGGDVGAGVGPEVVGVPVVGVPVVGLLEVGVGDGSAVGDGDGSAVYTRQSSVVSARPVVCDIIELVVMISAMSFWRSTQISSVSPLAQPLSSQMWSATDTASARATSGKLSWACV